MTDPERAAVLSLCAEIHELARQRPLSAALRRLDQKAAEVEAMLRQAPYEAG